MRRKWESGLEPQQVRCAWIGTLACIAMLGWSPATARAEEPGEPAPEDTAIDEADQAEVATPVTHEEIVHAQDAIDEAQRQLDEMKRRIGEIPVQAPSRMPGGAGLVTGPDGTAKKLQVSLNEDGSLYLRFATWLQVWGRAIQQNPGTVLGGAFDPDAGQYVGGNDDTWYGDAAIRRARFLLFGQIFPRTFILMHIGINNQTFRNARKPQLFFHDAFAEFQLSRNNAVYFGGGLLYWNGISRMTNASTITAMSLDLPIVNWPLIETSDQFARQLGFYLKGKFGLFDYRVSVTRPFTPYEVSLVAGTPPDPTASPGVANFRPDAQTWAYSGYFMLQFLDIESNVLPYTVGTYIGAKKVFNLGFGGYTQPWAMQYQDVDTGEIKSSTNVITGLDLFLDMPFKTEHGGAATWYAVYYYMNFGPNNIRNIGIMAEGAIDPNDNPSFNGAGNRYPMIGTGHTVYSELGFVLPFTVGQEIKFQPYVNTQLSQFEALDDVMAHFGVGINMFVHNHNAKVSLEYRNRPIFNNLDSADPNSKRDVRNRQGNSFILQLHLFI